MNSMKILLVKVHIRLRFNCPKTEWNRRQNSPSNGDEERRDDGRQEHETAEHPQRDNSTWNAIINQ